MLPDPMGGAHSSLLNILPVVALLQSPLAWWHGNSVNVESDWFSSLFIFQCNSQHLSVSIKFVSLLWSFWYLTHKVSGTDLPALLSGHQVLQFLPHSYYTASKEAMHDVECPQVPRSGIKRHRTRSKHLLKGTHNGPAAREGILSNHRFEENDEKCKKKNIHITN